MAKREDLNVKKGVQGFVTKAPKPVKAPTPGVSASPPVADTDSKENTTTPTKDVHALFSQRQQRASKKGLLLGVASDVESAKEALRAKQQEQGFSYTPPLGSYDAGFEFNYPNLDADFVCSRLSEANIPHVRVGAYSTSTDIPAGSWQVSLSPAGGVDLTGPIGASGDAYNEALKVQHSVARAGDEDSSSTFITVPGDPTHSVSMYAKPNPERMTDGERQAWLDAQVEKQAATIRRFSDTSEIDWTKGRADETSRNDKVSKDPE